MRPFDEHTHALQYPPTLRNRLCGRKSSRTKFVQQKKKRRCCRLPPELLHFHKWLLLGILTFVCTLVQFVSFQTQDANMVSYQAVAVLGWIAMVVLPVLQFDVTPVDMFNKRRNLIPTDGSLDEKVRSRSGHCGRVCAMCWQKKYYRCLFRFSSLATRPLISVVFHSARS